MAKYDEHSYGFCVTHLSVPTGRVYMTRGVEDPNFPIIKCDVQIGVDESTKQTGICIADMAGNPLMLIDCINISLPKAEVYLTLLKRWVRKVLPTLSVKRIIYEEINQNAPQMYARKRLMQVASIFEEYAIDADEDIEITCINNKTWKKHLLADSKYDGRRVNTNLVKMAIQEEVYDRIPALHEYKMIYYNGDSCDAYGIVYGYAKECFIDSACRIQRVNNTQKPTPLRSYSKTYYELETLTAMANRGELSLKNFKKLYYNTSMTLEENCLRAINYNPNGVILWGLGDEKIYNILRFDADREITSKTIIIVKYTGNKKT